MDPAFLVQMSASPMSRRKALRLAGFALGAICTTSPAHHALALKPGKPSKEKLLSSLKEEKTPEEIEAEKARIAEEKRIRLEKQKELQTMAEKRKSGLEEDTGNNVEIESNLRGQYYYPTARKRYLPRVKVAWETINFVEEAAKNQKWPDVSSMSARELSDAILPMKLYASSLAGGGLSINAKFIENMNSQTDRYEKALKQLSKAAKQKQTSVVLNNLTDMKGAIQKYREYGRLEAPDFGIGEIPTDTRVGSGFANNNSALYGRNKSFQDVSNER